MSFMDKVKDTAKGASVGSLVMGPVGVVGGAFKGTQISKQLGNLKSPSGKADTSAEEARKRAIINKLAEGPARYNTQALTEDDLAASKLNGTAYNDIGENSANAAAQQEAMVRYKEQADNGGFTASDRSNQAKAMRSAAQQDNARRQSIISDMQQRGTLGSGGELAAKLASADSAAAQNSQDSMNIAADGEQRRDQAIGNRANLASSLKDQDYRVAANKANANDAVSRFNSDLMSKMAFTNNQNRNTANQYNTGATNSWNQNISEMQYNQATDDQNAKLQKAAARKASYDKAASGIGTIAGAAVGSFGGPAGATVGASAGGAAGGIVSDKNRKKEIEPVSDIDLDSFLSSINPKSFNYKDEGDGKGKRVGFLAQDIENNPVGSAIVKDEDEGKEVDINNLLGALTAAIARLDEKKRDR